MLHKLLCAALCASLAALTGCATRDSRDAPWDPVNGQSLFEQIPNWDNNAGLRCGGHLPESKRGNRTDRC